MLYSVCIDWYAASCRVLNPATSSISPLQPAHIGGVLESDAVKFTIVEGREANPFFRRSLTLQYEREDAVHLFYEPKSSVVSASCAQAKVANRLLYCTYWYDILQHAIRAAGWVSVGITRLDVAIDLHRFLEGREPSWFIRDYLSRPTSSRPSFIRKSSNKFRAFGEKGVAGARYETMSWGTRESAVQVNLYNKSAELKVHDKPWIREYWAIYGLKPDEHDVWRIEFSMKSEALAIVGADGSFSEVCNGQLVSFGQLNELAAALVDKFFTFFYLSRDDVAKRRRVRDLKQVQLLDMSVAPEFKFVGLSHRQSTGRYEQQIIGKLQAICERIELTADEKRGLDAAIGRILDVVAMKRERTQLTLSAEEVLEGCILEAMSLKSAREASVPCELFTDEVGCPRGHMPSAEEARREARRWVTHIMHGSERGKDVASHGERWQAAFDLVDTEVEMLRDTLRDMMEHAPARLVM